VYGVIRLLEPLLGYEDMREKLSLAGSIEVLLGYEDYNVRPEGIESIKLR
jgi:hypothetical protein